mmetsp:Transcript_35798/g.94863  ORF Transcript_35798/g.94863 Transcript_35798/m.94863 type:complete len:370 (-) Transcript_35798:95-1204(-)
MVIKAHILRLTPYLPPLEGRNPDKFTLLDFNERTLPPPAAVTQALKDFIDRGGLQRYPAYGSLQAQIAEYSGVPLEECMFTNGSDQGIDLVVRCCCEKGTEVIIPSPTFAMYEQAAESEGVTIVRPHFTLEKGFPLEAVLAAVTPKTSMIVLSNPNNPTGTIIPRAAIMEIAQKCPKIAILVDECYYEFMDAKETVKDEVAAHPNLFVTRTFSKTWGLPSLRLGYLISAAENIRALCCVRGPYDVNQLAAVAVEAALANRQYVWDYVEEINKRSKPKFEDFLRSRDITFWPSHANFIFCYFKDPAQLEVGIRGHGILVRPKKDADGATGLRVTIGTLEQTERLIKVLEELGAAGLGGGGGEPAAKRARA